MQYIGLMVDLSGILEENDNGVIHEDAIRMFHLIGTRLDRLERSSVTLRESVMQLREAYQSQVDIDANLMMRLFTVVSTIRLESYGSVKERNICNSMGTIYPSTKERT